MEYDDDEVSISLNINRLSGDIPSVYDDIKNIDMLKGSVAGIIDSVAGVIICNNYSFVHK
jgi:hypothetical protein